MYCGKHAHGCSCWPRNENLPRLKHRKHIAYSEFVVPPIWASLRCHTLLLPRFGPAGSFINFRSQAFHHNSKTCTSISILYSEDYNLEDRSCHTKAKARHLCCCVVSADSRTVTERVATALGRLLLQANMHLVNHCMPRTALGCSTR